MPIYTTTARRLLRILSGSNTVNDIDQGFADLAADVDALLLVQSFGVVDIAATQSRTNTAYGLMATADQVTGLVVPTNGLIVVAYQATWQNSVGNAGKAALFIGANQLKVSDGASVAPVVQEVGSISAGADATLASASEGLVTGGAVGYTGDVATGQVVGLSGSGGLCVIGKLPAATYSVSVQTKSTSGSVTLKNRRLFAASLGA